MSSPYRLRPAPPEAASSSPRFTAEDLEDLREGVRLFNAGKFWDSHEAWEKIWQRHAEPWRFFVQGLIQAAASHHQIQRRIRHGAIKHLKNALAKLDTAPSDFGGLDLDEFRSYLRVLVIRIESSGERDWAEVEFQPIVFQRADKGTKMKRKN